MAAKHEVTSLAEYKQELLARSEVYRQTLVLQGKELQNSLSWVPRTVGVAKSAAPFMALGLPLFGLLLFKRKKVVAPVSPRGKQAARKKGVLAMVLGGIELYNRFKPLLNAFAQHRGRNGAVPQRSRTAAHPVR
jgi:hypothetical protein